MTSLQLPSGSVASDRPLRITAYSCDPDETALFHQLAPRCGVVISTTANSLSDAAAAPVSAVRCVSVGHNAKVTEVELHNLKAAGVAYLSTRSIGLDHIDVGTAMDLGITVENVIYAPDGVADFTIMLILMAVRNAEALVNHTGVGDVGPSPVRGGDLRDLTVGVVGVGNIGRAVIRRLHGFGCRVLACDNGTTTAGSAELVALDRLLSESDVVTLHLPLEPGTHHLIGHAQLTAMRKGALLVNTARGALVDTGALLSSLQSGHLGGAALDVVEGEERLVHGDSTPRDLTDQRLRELQQLPNVTMTPHVAYRTRRTVRETVERTLANCLAFERSRAR